METTEFIFWATKAIREIDPTSEFVLRGDDLEGIEWHKVKKPEPTVEQIEAKIESVKTNFATDQAQRATDKSALLERLGLTEDEAKLLIS